VGWFALAGTPPPVAPLRPRLADLVPAAPRALLDAVEAAVDPDPARRPPPLDLARAVHAACRPAPLWRSRAGPDDGDLTRRLRAACAGTDSDGLDGAEGLGGVDRLGGAHGGAGTRSVELAANGARHRVEGRMRPRLVVAGALGCGLLATGLALAVGTPHSGQSGSAVGSAGGASGGPLAGSAGGSRAGLAGGSRAGSAGGSSGGSLAGSAGGSARRAVAGASVGTAGSPARSSRPVAGAPARDGPYGDLRRPGTARDVVRDLLVRRAAELAGPRSGIAETTVPGSPAAAVDAAARRSLVTARLSYRRLRLTLREVSVRSASNTAADVFVIADTSGYDVVDEAGRVRSRVPPRAGAPALLHLARTARGWRVASVTAADAHRPGGPRRAGSAVR
jgi:hypothetical protein